MSLKQIVAKVAIAVLGACQAYGAAPDSTRGAVDHIEFSFPASDVPGRLYRSTSRFGPADLRGNELPVSTPFAIRPGQTRFRDTLMAQGVNYYYGLQRGKEWLTYGPVGIPGRPLPSSNHPMIKVDKANYTLSVVSEGVTLKRYPIVMGSRPMRRKFEQDRASTPEGRYVIYGCQPKATFHRAYDMDYPRPVDRARHDVLGSALPIGGEIQIHGDGIDGNWTWGCMALRNEDMDELFRHPEIGAGTPLWIAGGELTWADLESDALGPLASPVEIGRFQLQMGLPVTCISDVATCQMWSVRASQRRAAGKQVSRRAEPATTASSGGVKRN
jgi:hypothetical protein